MDSSFHFGFAKRLELGRAQRQIALQKSQTAQREIFRQRTTQATIADRCGFNRGTEIACEFIAS
jgi:hypothetical protein